MQHFGCLHEGQGHSMTFQQNRVWPITLIFEVRFYIVDHHIDTTCGAQHLGHYLEGQDYSMTLQHNCFQPITMLF